MYLSLYQMQYVKSSTITVQQPPSMSPNFGERDKFPKHQNSFRKWDNWEFQGLFWGENSIFYVVILWILKDIKERSQYIEQLLTKIDYSAMRTEFFLDVVPHTASYFSEPYKTNILMLYKKALEWKSGQEKNVEVISRPSKFSVSMKRRTYDLNGQNRSNEQNR